jgi:hypothetical protein
VAKLKDGDTINIAEGVYVGREETGSDTVGAAVKIIGGWADDFSKRDPWGAHRTVFAGEVRWSFGGGRRATRRRTRASAVRVNAVPFFGEYSYRPSSNRRSRDSATGPRAPYLHYAESRIMRSRSTPVGGRGVISN